MGAGAPGRAVHFTGGMLGLLFIDQPKEGTFGNSIALQAIASDPTVATKDFVARNAQSHIKLNPENNRLLGDTFAVDYGGKRFFRSDYTASLRDGHTFYISLVFTRFRDYDLGEMLNTSSAEELDDAADSLQRISFLEDIPNSKCVVGDDSQSGVIGGIISATPRVPISDSARIRVSTAV